MASRLQLHEELCSVLGSRKCYYQPPETVKMAYPCIRYELTKSSTRHANDKTYIITHRYEVMLIDKNPDSIIPDRILTHFPMCSLDRTFTADNLYHFVFYIYY